MFGVHAGAAQEEQFLNTVPVGGLDHVDLDRQVFTKEVGRIRLVGQDAADAGSGEVDLLGPSHSKNASTAGESVRSSCWRVRSSNRDGQRPGAA